VHPGSAPGGVLVAPGAGRRHITEKDRAQARDVDIMLEEDLHLIAKAPAGAPVVVVPVDAQAAVGLLTGKVPFCADRPSLGYGDVADTWIDREQVRQPVGAIVDDDQLTVRVVLQKPVPDRPGNQVAAIVGRHDAGDERSVPWPSARRRDAPRSPGGDEMRPDRPIGDPPQHRRPPKLKAASKVPLRRAARAMPTGPRPGGSRKTA